MSAYGKPFSTSASREDQYDCLDSFNSNFSTDTYFDPSGFGYYKACGVPELASSGQYWPGDLTMYMGNQPYGHAASLPTDFQFEIEYYSNPGSFTNALGQDSQHYIEARTTRTTTEGSGLSSSRQTEWYTSPSHWAGMNATTISGILPSLNHSSTPSNGASSPSAYSSSSGIPETHIPVQMTTNNRQLRPHKLPIFPTSNNQGSVRSTRSRASRPVEELRCSEPGCRSRSFRRPYELHRHEDSAHSRIRYRCVECHSQNIPYSRNRADKILDHYTRKHKTSVQRQVEKYELGDGQ